MSIKDSLTARSNNICELCGSTNHLDSCEVPPSDNSSDQFILICSTCNEQISDPTKMDENHWRCLNDSMWSPIPAVQVMSYRLLHKLRSKGWSQDLLDMMYLEDDVKKWAEFGISDDDESTAITKDSNGATLQEGDDVTLIKDLVVKGANFTAKRGTLVRNINLVDNPLHIEGKVNGTQIVLVSAFLKKA